MSATNNTPPCPNKEKCDRIMARQMDDESWKCIRSGCELIWKEIKECLHEWHFTFIVDWCDLTCKKCHKDVFDLYEKDDAVKIYNKEEQKLKNDKSK